MFKIHNDEAHIFRTFHKKMSKFMHMIPGKNAIIISHHLRLILGKTAWDIQVQFSGIKF